MPDNLSKMIDIQKGNPSVLGCLKNFNNYEVVNNFFLKIVWFFGSLSKKWIAQQKKRAFIFSHRNG